jgi:hypothetical protein
MFNIEFGENGDILCSGRLDAAQCAIAQEFMDVISGPSVLDFDHIYDVFRYSGFQSIFEIEAQ